MMRNIFLFASFLLTAAATVTTPSSQGGGGPQVTLKQGPVEGKYEKSLGGRQFMAFWGIPYAKPPTGKHRFKDSVPSGPWPGTLRAIQMPNDCIQYDHLTYKTDFHIHGSEDCLYVNLFTPKIPTGQINEKLMDVIVYIHGGAFTYGAGRYYGPKFLMDKDVVYITLNYRLGPLGFLSTEDDLVPGNNGLKDQVLALKWIKDNVAAFGGNPQSITIAGMSAGGASVHYHMLSPLSRGLFQKAISMSGSAFNAWTLAENSKEKAKVLSKELGCPIEGQLMIDCLRQRSAKDIVEASKQFMSWMYNPFSPFGPVVEKPSSKAFIDRHPVEIIESKQHNDVPWLVSFTSDEGLYPGTEILCDPSAFEELIQKWTDIAHHLLDFSYTIDSARSDQIKKEIYDKYLSGNSKSQRDGLIEMLSDRLFVADVVQAAKNQSALSTSPVFVYQFSYRGHASLSDYLCHTKENFGVSHGDDFGFIASDFIIDPNINENDKQMTNHLVDMWTSFASKGKPNFGNLQLNWPSLQESSPDFTFLDIRSPQEGVIMKQSDMGNVLFWNSLGLLENAMVTNLKSTKDEL